MKKKVLIGIGIVIILLAVGLLVYAGIVLNNNRLKEEKYFKELTISELQEKIDNKESFILVISQTTCSHCAEYKPRIKKVLAKYEVTGYYIEKDLLNAEETTQLNNIANISGTPATIFIIDGEEKSSSTRISGARSTDVIVSRLKAMGYIKK
ncbi:MAG: thioredoxin family protein [Bacilli bacterium]|nr:thioredoxin family protein [Bacilli bacterium]